MYGPCGVRCGSANAVVVLSCSDPACCGAARELVAPTHHGEMKRDAATTVESREIIQRIVCEGG